MGTRSNIAYKKATGEIVSMYCHYDGYPEHNGVVLNNHYNTKSKARALVDNGYQSALKTTVEESNEGRVHEEPPITYRSFHSFIIDINFDIEWVYLFKDDCWHVAETSYIGLPSGKYDIEVDEFKPLTDSPFFIAVGDQS
jgi:hypothetical protein|tara:strand:+ start:1432 stop:1851 length:420 start_codon:yes stop_codon:yes gene_type:complete